MVGGNQSGGGVAALVILLLVVGLIIKFIWWILGALAIVAAAFIVIVVARAQVRQDRKAAAERDRHHASLVARADRQHAWVLDGDSRGIYGQRGAEFMCYVDRGNWDGLLRKMQQPPDNL